MPFHIRCAKPEDAETACGVLRRSIEECCIDDHHRDPKILAGWLANKTTENVRSWFDSTGYAVLAEDSDGIVGVAMLNGGGRITLNYLIPEACNKGMGRAMLAALEAEARRRGFGQVELTSTGTAHKFYLRNGYSDTGKNGSAFGMSAPNMIKTLTPAVVSNQSKDPTP
jgi:GNAT superfamily N-acetyltransferase